MKTRERIRSVAGNPHRGTLMRALAGSCGALSRADAIDDARLEDCLQLCYRWLCAAQDATPDAGVSGWFDYSSGRWSSSYPETTGYIIPTFLALAAARDEPGARERALRMAAWEVEMQLPDGAVLSGVLGTPRGPAVFNTGQALFGWIAAYTETGEQLYELAARAAAEWLIALQDADGAWRKSLSMVTSAPVHAYNGRCCWALAYAADALGEERYTEAARRGADWVCDQQNEMGWFAHNGFAQDEVPLLHTIAYAIEGLLGVYAYTDATPYLAAATAALDPLMVLQREHRLAGRLGPDWQPTVSWRCVTGDAQLAVLLHRLERHRPGMGYGRAARDLTCEAAAMQLRLAAPRGPASTTRIDPPRGGLPGSFPVWGGYTRLAQPNWATKFFLDALMLELDGVDELSYPAHGRGQGGPTALHRRGNKDHRAQVRHDRRAPDHRGRADRDDQER